MRPRKLKNSALWGVILLAVCISVIYGGYPEPAQAYNFQNPTVLDPVTKKVCPSAPGFTERIIVCVKESIISAAYRTIAPFALYVGGFVTACMTLAVALWGTLMAAGKNSAPVRDLAVMAVKIGCVSLFAMNFSALFIFFLDMMEYMLDAVTVHVGYSPSFNCPLATPSINIGVWQRVDCTINSLIGGIFNPAHIYFGLTGFLVAALFSQAVGLFIGIIGLLVIIQLIWACIRGVYIFISAYIAFALMAIVSPLFIPLILFRTTKGYFEKWLKITIGFILQPIFLFTYLSMLMAAYDVIVYTGNYSLYRAIAGNAVNGFDVQSQNTLGRWMHQNGVYTESSQSSVAFNVEPKKIIDSSVGFALQKINTGVIGATRNISGDGVKLTEQVTDESEWRDQYGNPQDIIMNRLGPASYFRVDMPIKKIDWQNLSAMHCARINCSNPQDPTDYWVYLFLCCIMALLTAYIFLLLIDLLPFIGSGVAGDALSMPAFGTGPFAPPGDSLMTNIKDRFLGNPMGGRR